MLDEGEEEEEEEEDEGEGEFGDSRPYLPLLPARPSPLLKPAPFTVTGDTVRGDSCEGVLSASLVGETEEERSAIVPPLGLGVEECDETRSTTSGKRDLDRRWPCCDDDDEDDDNDNEEGEEEDSALPSPLLLSPLAPPLPLSLLSS